MVHTKAWWRIREHQGTAFYCGTCHIPHPVDMEILTYCRDCLHDPCRCTPSEISDKTVEYTSDVSSVGEIEQSDGSNLESARCVDGGTAVPYKGKRENTSNQNCNETGYRTGETYNNRGRQNEEKAGTDTEKAGVQTP